MSPTLIGASAVADARASADHDDEPTLPIGFMIADKYAIKRVLGVGGDGAVYQGEHSEIGHLVAIKVAHRSRSDREDIMERFRREARICGSLRHPNVGQIYDVGKLNDGSPYMVMELQEGRSLADVIDETALPIAAILDIVRQLLSGVGAAHRSGILHRDVKPDNVMLVRDRSGEVVVKLVDFGISKSLVHSDREVTAEGIIVGSPDYMPPEQLRGDPVDVRTDTYAVGVLLYEALTRQTPFDASNIPDLVASILRDPVKPPSQLRFDCPPELERVVLKAMSRDPAQRYQTADELSRALAALQDVVTRRVPDAQALLLGTKLTDPALPKRTRLKRTIDNRTLQDIGVQKKPELATLRPGVLRTKSRRVALGVGALLLLAAAVLRITGSGEPEREAPVARLPAPHVATTPSQMPVLPASAATRTTAPAPIAAPAAAPVSAKLPVAASNAVRRVATRRPTSDAVPSSTNEASAADALPIATLLKEAGTAFVRGDASRAHDLYRQVIARAPAQAEAWRGLGVVSSRIGQAAEAAHAYQRYLELRPDAPDSARIRELLTKLE